MRLRPICIWALLCWPLISCAATEHVAASAPAQAASVEVIANQPANWAGKTVKVSGRFSGWQGKCSGRPPVSRSDWMIESDSACLYVNGRLPPELSAIPPGRGIGDQIVVSGKVGIDQFGKAYIQSERVSLRKSLPRE